MHTSGGRSTSLFAKKLALTALVAAGLSAAALLSYLGIAIISGTEPYVVHPKSVSNPPPDAEIGRVVFEWLSKDFSSNA